MPIDWSQKPLNGRITASVDLDSNLNLKVKRKGIYITGIYADGGKGKGFGTRAMGYLISEGLAQGLEHFYLCAAHNSHFFHILMGMIPYDYELNYLATKYYSLAYHKQKSFEKVVNGEYDQLTEKDKKRISYVFRKEKKIAKEDFHQLSTEEIIENKEFIVALANKKITYIKDVFIPDLLYQFKHYVRNPKLSFHFQSIQMLLSDAGLSRWKETISQGKPFVPFYDLSHFHEFMDDEQKKTLSLYVSQMDEKKQPQGSYKVFAAHTSLFRLSTKSETSKADTEEKSQFSPD